MTISYFILDETEKAVPDYRMNLIDARHMRDEEIDCFTGDLRVLLLMFRKRFDRKKLKRWLPIIVKRGTL